MSAKVSPSLCVIAAGPAVRR